MAASGGVIHAIDPSKRYLLNLGDVDTDTVKAFTEALEAAGLTKNFLVSHGSGFQIFEHIPGQRYFIRKKDGDFSPQVIESITKALKNFDLKAIFFGGEFDFFMVQDGGKESE